MRAPNLCNMELLNSKFESYFFKKMKFFMLYDQNKDKRPNYQLAAAESCSFFSCFMIFFFS